jgi:phosphoribosylaminoimidazole-succinocarboxamide synthase
VTLDGLRLVNRGKVRDLYETEAGILMVASDRISAFDVVLPTPIPDKGAVLTGLSAFWFARLEGIVDNHLISSNVDDFPPEAKEHADALRGRTMLVRRADVIPIECVVRGYLSGSGWKEYRSSGSICGIALPSGLAESERLPGPLFTPTTKAEEGHDEAISFEQACEIAGRSTMERVRAAALDLYAAAAAYAEQRGVIIADTKFEFGTAHGGIVLIDEALTPDSSRFWPASEYAAGGPVPSFDKQYVRDWLDAQGWDHAPPAPELPPDVIESTRRRYVEAYERLTGRLLASWSGV